MEKSEDQGQELGRILDGADRYVCYEYCISVIFLTLRKPSRVHHLRPRELGLWRGLPYTLISLLLGWWGIPWGVIYTPLTIFTNLSGGRDVTDQVLNHQAS